MACADGDMLLGAGEISLMCGADQWTVSEVLRQLIPDSTARCKGTPCAVYQMPSSSSVSERFHCESSLANGVGSNAPTTRLKRSES